jgi:hypothetical protein
MVDAAHGIIYQVDLEARLRDLLAEVQTWDMEPTISELDGFAAEVEAADWTRDCRRRLGGAAPVWPQSRNGALASLSV